MRAGIPYPNIIVQRSRDSMMSIGDKWNIMPPFRMNFKLIPNVGESLRIP